MNVKLIGTVLLVATLVGCAADHPQSVLHPRGPAAGEIANLWWILFYLCTGVFVIVAVLTLYAICRSRTDRAPGDRFIIITAVILPAIVLVVLMFFSLGSGRALRAPETVFTIHVVGHQWWWDVQYVDHDIRTANEFYIPVGTPVRIDLTSADVIHSFWVPNLQGKMDLIPGHSNSLWIQADVPGRYRGQCAEFCGLQHALMALEVVALPAEDFEQWVMERRRPHPPPQTESLRRGHAAFFTSGCNKCHAIRDTQADGRTGPDLTHIGSRLTLGAGTLPNVHGNLAGWIANPQPLKPGNFMPASKLEPEDFHALVEYLMSLQ